VAKERAGRLDEEGGNRGRKNLPPPSPARCPPTARPNHRRRREEARGVATLQTRPPIPWGGNKKRREQSGKQKLTTTTEGGNGRSHFPLRHRPPPLTFQKPFPSSLLPPGGQKDRGLILWSNRPSVGPSSLTVQSPTPPNTPSHPPRTTPHHHPCNRSCLGVNGVWRGGGQELCVVKCGLFLLCSWTANMHTPN